MTDRSSPSSDSPSLTRSLILIAITVGALALAFAYTAGWFTPDRLTPSKVVDAIAPPQGPALGFRRNHAKGICFTGTFQANGAGSAVSKARMFAPGSYPVTGRFNLATPDPKTADATARVRGLSLRIVTPDGQDWRSAMIDAPFFPVSTPQAFYDLQKAAGRKHDPSAMKQFVTTHPEFSAFGAWAGSTPFTASYTHDRYNSLNSFVFTNTAGQDQTVRWSFVPEAQPATVTAEDLKQRGADVLATDLVQRVAGAPQRWRMTLIVAKPGDVTANPSKAWPEDRQHIDAGTLVVQAIQQEANGPCRDINFDPTVLPPGMRVSDDPFPSARSAAYAVSFDRRTAEDAHYPHTASGAKP